MRDGNSEAGLRVLRFGQGSDPRYAELTVVYDGGREGLMGVVADAAITAGGTVIGVMPSFLRDREHRHEGLAELVVTADMHTRCDAFVALPGGIGTLEETAEALSWSTPGLQVLPDSRYWSPLVALLEHMDGSGFPHRSLGKTVDVVDTPEP